MSYITEAAVQNCFPRLFNQIDWHKRPRRLSYDFPWMIIRQEGFLINFSKKKKKCGFFIVMLSDQRGYCMWVLGGENKACMRAHTHSACFLIFSFLPTPFSYLSTERCPPFSVSQTLTINALARYKNSIWLGPKDSDPHTSQFLD